MGRFTVVRKKARSMGEARFTGDFAGEFKRLESAVQKLSADLERLYEAALARVGEGEASIFEIHKMMLEDDDFIGETKRLIKDEWITSEKAVTEAAEALRRRFSDMDSEYMRARADDIVAISHRLCDILSGVESGVNLKEPSIVASENLTPAETIELDRGMVKGFVTQHGSNMSHTAILSRMMGIPSVVNLEGFCEDDDGKFAILDGDGGVLFIDPDEGMINKYRESQRRLAEEARRLDMMRGKRCINKYGERVYITSNISEPDDIDEAMKNDSEGVGLFRSEFIFMRRGTPPTEDEQFMIYRAAAEKLGGMECVVRTLDVGADKKIPYLTGERKEANPALGIRAIRLCMKMPELLKTQLRALYRAAAYGNISVMIPMIVLPSEVEGVIAITREVRDELRRDGISYGEMKLGIMIETPSAAILSDLLAPMVDFFSIGTNDLIQYTCAADRENPDVGYLTSPIPESVRRCIKMACAAARREGIPVSVCGEVGADTDETAFLIDEGVTKLSVAPAYVLRVREKVYRMAPGG